MPLLCSLYGNSNFQPSTPLFSNRRFLTTLFFQMRSSLYIISNGRVKVNKSRLPKSGLHEISSRLSLVRRQAIILSPSDRLDKIPRPQVHPHTGACSSSHSVLISRTGRSTGSSRVHAQASPENAPSVPLTYAKPAIEQRQLVVLASAALLGFSVLSDDLPLLRLIILTYSVWATGEWIVHRLVLITGTMSGGTAGSHVHYST